MIGFSYPRADLVLAPLDVNKDYACRLIGTYSTIRYIDTVQARKHA
jgi:hypothetical protein